MSTQVAHLGVLRVRWTWMSSRVEPHGHARAVAHQRVDERAGMSRFVIESPNSYCFVACSSTAPSPTTGPWCRPVRDGANSLKQPLQQLALKQPIRLGREAEAACLLLQALLLGHLAQVVLDLLLQRAELVDVARLGELGRAAPCR